MSWVEVPFLFNFNTILGPEMLQIFLAAGALPRTPLGGSQRPQTPQLDWVHSPATAFSTLNLKVRVTPLSGNMPNSSDARKKSEANFHIVNGLNISVPGCRVTNDVKMQFADHLDGNI